MFNLIPDYVKEAPLYHLAVEAFLFVWILWLLFRKSYKPVEKNKLTEKVFQVKLKYFTIEKLLFRILFKDKKELLDEWTPEPLVPNYDSKDSIINPRVVEG